MQTENLSNHLRLHQTVLALIDEFALPPFELLRKWPQTPADRHFGLTYVAAGVAVDFYFEIGGEFINVGPDHWTGQLVPIEAAHFVFGLTDMLGQREMNMPEDFSAAPRFSSTAARLADVALLRAAASTQLTDMQAVQRRIAYNRWHLDQLSAEYDAKNR